MTKLLLALLCVAMPMMAAQCDPSQPMNDAVGWNGWGGSLINTRYQPNTPYQSPERLPKSIDWAFGFPGARQIGPPTVVGGRTFIGADTGEVYALGPQGCVHWMYKADAGVRTAIVIGEAGNRKAALFGDQRGKAYAVDANTGQLLWKTQLEDHASAKITGAPAVFEDRVYFPVSSGEEGAGGGANYKCCTFRGSVVALMTGSGRIVWKTYTIPEPPGQVGENRFAPSGAAVWSAPTIDVKRRAIYVTTGDAYSEPAAPTTDAVLALDLDTGAIRWSVQDTKDDVWIAACMRPNGPKDCGPDHDFGAPAALVTINGRDLLIAGQKSGNVWAHDPDNKGAVVWRTPLVPNTEEFGGKIVWGGAMDEDTAYFGLGPGGIAAVNLADGKIKWSHAISPVKGMETHPGHEGPLVAMPGGVISGGWDGMLRGLSKEDGRVLWTADTAISFETVNGVPGKGGSMGAAGPVLVGPSLFVPSGYVGVKNGVPGNVLLYFRPR